MAFFVVKNGCGCKKTFDFSIVNVYKNGSGSEMN